MERNYFEEYLVSIKPEVDPNLWNKATGSIKSTIQNTIFKPFTKQLNAARAQLEELTKKQKEISDKLKRDTSARQKISEIEKELKTEDLTAKERKDLTSQAQKLKEQLLPDKERKELSATLQKTNKDIDTLGDTVKGGEAQLASFSKGLSTAGAFMTIYIAVVKAAIETLKKVVSEAKDISNQFVSQSSIQVDPNVRNIMGKFGVDTNTALGISTASEILGYDINEYSKWTQAQREAFAKLMKDYQTGIDNINPKKLEQFNDAVQEYQLMVASFQLKFKIALTDMLANSDGLVDVLDTVSDALGSIGDILSSDAVKFGFDILMGAINGILKFVTAPLNFLGSLFGGGSSTTNKNVTVNNNINSTRNIDESQLAVDIGLSVRNAMAG